MPGQDFPHTWDEFKTILTELPPLKCYLRYLKMLVLHLGFLFDEMSDGMRCKGVSMLCPPMCRKYDSSGCVTCDCNHINPAMPMDPSNSHFNPANPMNGGYTMAFKLSFCLHTYVNSILLSHR